MIQPCHNFAHATTAQLSWHVQNCDMIESSFSTSDWNIFLQDLDNELMNPLWDGPLGPVVVYSTAQIDSNGL